MHTIFFPSFAFSALARSSHSICASERINCCISQRPHWGVKRERGPLRSPESTPGCKRNQQHKPKQSTKTKTNQKRKPLGSVDMLRQDRQLLCRLIQERSCRKQYQPARHHSKIPVKMQKRRTDQQCRNPGSAQRIREIAL